MTVEFIKPSNKFFGRNKQTIAVELIKPKNWWSKLIDHYFGAVEINRP